MVDVINAISTTGVSVPEFVREEVLKNAEQVQRRKDNLYMALILGNNYNKVARITAHTRDGVKLLEGVLLALTDAYVILKSGVKVPTHSIEEVSIY